jgi:N-acetylmuramoyl-L-alanine amidase
MFALPISSASNVTDSSSAVNVKITPTTVTATGYNSASGGYFWTTGKFENYDPFSHEWGVLEWNPKGTLEGEWTSKASDADFSIDGQCKSGHSSVHLVPVQNISSPTNTPATNTTPTTKIQTIPQENLINVMLNESFSSLLVLMDK